VKKLSKTDQLKHEKEYLEFLEKRLNSVNYKKNVASEEYEKTQEKYKKAKFKLRLLEK
jgi:hypothetical protein